MTVDNDELAVVGDYKKGSITEIRLENFLTYSNVVIRPGPRLNMVVGPNGTGKSSVLNAICLGLGGSKNVLGRADDVRNFIQHGKDKAMIEITLAPGDHVIRRELDRNKGSEKGRGRGASTFYVNGEKFTEAQVSQLVHEEYNIQVENLCTFLPQDKVGSFSGLTPEEYLEALEKALSANLYETHQGLIESEKKLKNTSTDWKALETKLNAMQQEQERLELEKERMEERRIALEQLDILDKKRLWLEVESLREQAVELKERKTELKNRIKEKAEELAPFQEELDAVQTQVQEQERNIRQASQKATTVQQQINRQKELWDGHDSEIESKLVEWRDKENERNQLQDKITAAEGKVESFQAQLAEMPSMEELQQKHDETRNNYRESNEAWQRAKNQEKHVLKELGDAESEAKRQQTKMENLASESTQRRLNVFSNYPNLKKIDAWLQGNRHLFPNPVVGPIACEISPKSPYAAAILEQHISNNVLKGFIVKTRQEYDLLYQKVRTEQDIPINIYLADSGEVAMKRPYSDAKMNVLKDEHGVQGYLDELLECPESVLQTLCSNAGIQKVVVGSKRTQKSVDEANLLGFLSESETPNGPKVGYTIALTDGHSMSKYTAIISRYSNKPSIRQDSIAEARLLAKGVDTAEQERIQAKLQEAHDELARLRPRVEKAATERIEAEKNTSDAKDAASAAKQRVESLRKLEGKLQNAQNNVEQLMVQAQEDRDSRATKSLAEQLMKQSERSLKALEAIATYQKELQESKFLEIHAAIAKTVVASKERRLRSQIEDLQKGMENLRQEAEEVSRDFARAKNELSTKKNEAVRDAPLKDDEGNDLPLREQLEALQVETLHDLEAAYEEAEARANAIVDNPEALHKYEEQKQKIEEMSARLADAKEGQSRELSQVKLKRNTWETSLECHVSKINTLFSEYMKDMDCAGEVVLRKGEEGEGEQEELANFADWGIEIRVSFRAGSKLQVLDSMKQSGGERSVSTIMYLMAMQDLMVAPFRCVDEINQGLDDRNERLVFKRIVQNSTKPPKRDLPTGHNGQYFLITPKLLPNLTDMEEAAMTVLFVFNGPANFASPTEWSVEDIIKASAQSRKRQITGEENDEENSQNTQSQRGQKVRRSEE